MAYLTLSNGAIFEGHRIGASVDCIGELVFSTGMAGYLETLTDPSYYAQIVTQSFPLIGNYGVIPEDFEGTLRLFGYIVRELSNTPSNFRSEGKLNDFLLAHGIPGLCGADTREIVRTVREEGVMNAMISDTPPADLSALQAFRVENAVAAVTCREKQVFQAEGEKRFRAALLDCGVKRGIVHSLQKRGCEVTVWPAGTKAENVLADDPDGIVLSNGPGDPKENGGCIAEIRKMLGAKPMMGICLGHQLIALAMGGNTVKLKYGHRGGNQPVKDLTTGRSFITSQKASFAAKEIPVLTDTDEMINQIISIGDKEYPVTCVSVGNPHCVVFCDAIDGIDLSVIGPQFEYADIFPERVNTEFARVINKTTLRLRVWERGSGETLACGTGACAAVAAAVRLGLLPAGKAIDVKLPGGMLSVQYTEDGMQLTGDTLLTFEGCFVY